MKTHLTNRVRAHALLLQKMLFGMFLLGLTVTAYAVPINGEIGFSDEFTPVLADGITATTLDNATGIDFKDDRALVVNATGDFVGLASTLAIFTDFQFADPFSSVSPLWTVGGFSFDLMSLVVDVQNVDELKLSGVGTVSGNGFEVTEGTWSLTGNGGGTAFAWSGGTLAAPAPPVLWLLWSGLVGMIGVSRMKSALCVPNDAGLSGQDA